VYFSKAYLYFYINSESIRINNTRNKLWIKISYLKKKHNTTQLVHIRKKLVIHQHLTGWHSTPLPSKLIRHINKMERLRFKITCVNCDYTPFMLENNPPFLTVQTQRRSKRNNSEEECHGKCCTNRLIVDFEAIGWKWVLYPKQFTANYCAGDCSAKSLSSRDRLKVSSHTLVLQLMFSKLNIGASGTCCVPAEESPLQIIYIDNHGVVRSNMNTIKTIKSCKCY